MKFKVKRHWWIWALWILWHIFAVRFFQVGMYNWFFGTVILDIFLVFPDAAHFRYEIMHRQLTVRRIIYPDISFPCDSIIAVEKSVLIELATPAGIYKNSLGAYTITYFTDKGIFKMRVVIISAKERQRFLNELSLNVKPLIKLDIRELLKDDNINGTVTWS